YLSTPQSPARIAGPVPKEGVRCAHGETWIGHGTGSPLFERAEGKVRTLSARFLSRLWPAAAVVTAGTLITMGAALAPSGASAADGENSPFGQGHLGFHPPGGAPA